VVVVVGIIHHLVSRVAQVVAPEVLLVLLYIQAEPEPIFQDPRNKVIQADPPKMVVAVEAEVLEQLEL
jgi:hypothetical protein